MNRFQCGLFVFAMFAAAGALAGNLKSVPVEATGTVTAYVSVPQEFTCHLSIPDNPTAFCSGPGNRVYHMGTMGVLQGVVNGDQYFGELVRKANEAPGVKVLEYYALPEISQYQLQRDAPLLYLRGEQVTTYGFDAMDTNKGEVSVSALVIASFPNNGTPASRIDAYSVSVPADAAKDLGKLRGELVRFVNSYRYDDQWVQISNAQTVNFEGNLRARENAFYSTQQSIHQNNMDALDSSHRSYMGRSAASDRIQSRSVDSIHDRQQLVNPATGQRYEADGYYDYNYANPNDPNMSVRTNDASWDPNVNVNQGEYYDRLEDYDPSDR